MPRSPCLEPWCPRFATYRGRCEEHAPPRERETHRPRPHARTPGGGRVYGTKRWRVLRAKRLRANPVCQSCEEAVATDVDHVVPIEDGGRPYAWANTQSLCPSCHGRKTAGEVRSRKH